MSRETDLNGLKGNFSSPSNTTVGPVAEMTPPKAKPNYQVIYEVLPIAVVIIVVNSMVFYLFAKSKRLRTPTNCLLLSLAVCDFMAGFICIPLFIIVVIPVFKPPQLHLGRFNVVFNNFMAITAAYHILSITLERYFCITRPFAHRRLTKKSMLKVAFLVWVVAAVIGFMPYAWFSLQLKDIVDYQKTQSGYVIFCLTFVFVVPCVLIVVSQTLTFKAIAKSGGNGLTATKAAQRKARNEKKCLIIFALMAFIYVVCWLPWFVLYLYFSFWFPLSQETYHVLGKLAQVFVILRYITSIVNPLLYTFFKQDFLRAFKRLVLRIRPPVQRNHFSTTTSTMLPSATLHQKKLIASVPNSNEHSEENELISTV
ncbi:hypothetical protein ACROYT_G033516 [Oculina patagonica]